MADSVQVQIKSESIALGDNGLLTHQAETLDALDRSPIVMNCAMTGAGKTRASHLGVASVAKDKSVLFIAPTNALVSQHETDAKEFVAQNDLSHAVVAADGYMLFKLMKTRPGLFRSSAVLHQLIYNPRAFGDVLGIGDRKAPLWLITNPDQVWMSIVSGREQDTRNLLQDFVTRFQFVVVDEFHYYTAEQLTLFLLCTALWKHFGQFDNGLKMLLLTATPDETVRRFFERMEVDCAIVGNNNDTTGKSIPALSPIELTLTTGTLYDHLDPVKQWYHSGRDGVMISDSLYDINRIYAMFAEDRATDYAVGRITGPIDNPQRKIESEKRLILATPTVDLGYNFIKPFPKDRQEIDFVVSTVRNKSSFWQRIGRAGRVLGRKITDEPSQAVMILPTSSCFQRLKPLEGKMMDRSEIKALLDIDDKQLKHHALAREGLFAATRQLLEIEKMLPENVKSVIEEIFQTLKKSIDPTDMAPDWPSMRSRHWLSNTFNRIRREYPFLNTKVLYTHISDSGNENSSADLDVLIGAWTKDFWYRKNKLEKFESMKQKNPNWLKDAKSFLKKMPGERENLIRYYREQTLRLDYLFNFRGAESRKTVRIYDPLFLYSAHMVRTMDLITLLCQFEYEGPLYGRQAGKEWNIPVPEDDMCFKLKGFLDKRYYPEFEYAATLPVINESHEENAPDAEIIPPFWRTVVLHDMEINITHKDCGPRPVPLEIKKRLEGFSELFFITPIENKHIFIQWLNNYDVLSGKLNVCNEFGKPRTYQVIYGKDAIFISEELYIKWKTRTT